MAIFRSRFKESGNYGRSDYQGRYNTPEMPGQVPYLPQSPNPNPGIYEAPQVDVPNYYASLQSQQDQRQRQQNQDRLTILGQADHLSTLAQEPGLAGPVGEAVRPFSPAFADALAARKPWEAPANPFGGQPSGSPAIPTGTPAIPGAMATGPHIPGTPGVAEGNAPEMPQSFATKKASIANRIYLQMRTAGLIRNQAQLQAAYEHIDKAANEELKNDPEYQAHAEGLKAATKLRMETPAMVDQMRVINPLKINLAGGEAGARTGAEEDAKNQPDRVTAGAARKRAEAKAEAQGKDEGAPDKTTPAAYNNLVQNQIAKMSSGATKGNRNAQAFVKMDPVAQRQAAKKVLEQTGVKEPGAGNKTRKQMLADFLTQ